MFRSTLYRELLLTWRDRTGVALLVVVPALAMAIGGFALRAVFEGTGPRVLVAVVDEDGQGLARMLLSAFEKAPVIDVVRGDAEHAGARLTRLTIPRGFSATYDRGDRPRLTLETDPGHEQEASVVRTVLAEFSARVAASQVASRLAAAQIIARTGDLDPVELRRDLVQAVQDPEMAGIDVEERTVTSPNQRIRSFDMQVPGLAIMFLLFGMLGGVGRRILEDESTGRLQRILLAPGRPMSMLGGLLSARALVGVVQMTILIVFGHVAFGLPLGSSPVALILVIVVVVFAAVSFGHLIGALATSEEQLTAMGVALILSMAALGGCWWPLFLEPPWMQRLADITITRWSMEALTAVLLRGEGVREVMWALCVLGSFGIAALACGFGAYHRRWQSR